VAKAAYPGSFYGILRLRSGQASEAVPLSKAEKQKQIPPFGGMTNKKQRQILRSFDSALARSAQDDKQNNSRSFDSALARFAQDDKQKQQQILRLHVARGQDDKYKN
jgi:hypothetical protein